MGRSELRPDVVRAPPKDIGRVSHSHRSAEGTRDSTSSSTLASRGHRYVLDQPVLQADLAESRLAGRNQRALAELGPEVPRVRVDDNFAEIVARAEAQADQFVKTEL